MREKNKGIEVSGKLDSRDLSADVPQHSVSEQDEVNEIGGNCEPSAVRILMQLAAAVTIGLIAADISSRVYVNVYAYLQGVELRELSNDYGMGFFAILIEIGVFLAMVPLAYFLLQKLLKARTQH